MARDCGDFAEIWRGWNSPAARGRVGKRGFSPHFLVVIPDRERSVPK
jgi:hypothetical protein